MENTIFFGNGFNRCSENSQSWEQILKDVVVQNKEILNDILNTFQYEDIYLSKKVDFDSLKTIYNDKSDEWLIKKTMAQELLKTMPNVLHTKLAKLEVTHYITTNYDYLLENKLEKQRFILDDKASEKSEILYSIRRKNVYVNKEEKKDYLAYSW